MDRDFDYWASAPVEHLPVGTWPLPLQPATTGQPPDMWTTADKSFPGRSS